MARLVPCAAARSLSSTQPMSKPIAFQGTLLYCDPHDVGKIKVLKDHVVIVCTKGVIGHVGPAAFSDSQLKAHSLGPEDVKQLTPTQFLLPGFIDTHLHAPQYQFCGVGTDLPLFEWLNQYTFPAEARFSDCQHAHKVYTLLVQRLLRLGTTTANYYTTLQAGACQLLADIVKAAGQRAVIGKVSMDQNSPDSYVELDPAASLKAAHDVVKYIQGLQCSRLMPAVVPRFIPTCSAELLRGLAALAQEHDLHVHSHIAESRDEVDFSTKLHPGHENDAEIYSAVGLLRPKAIFAHGTQLTDTALQLMAQKGAAIAHCPLSNMYFGDGLLDVCKTLRTGVRVGLGTDIAGGYSPSMLSAIRMAVVNSHAMKAAALMYGSQDKDQQALEQQQQPATQQQSSNSTNEVPKQQQAASGFNGFAASRVVEAISNPAVSAAAAAHMLTWQDALWLATAGGAAALGLQDKVGHFAVGMEFDALLVDTEIPAVFDSLEGADDPMLQLERFVNLGDDRNIVAVYVQGKQVV